jgi:hypothetical protein
MTETPDEVREAARRAVGWLKTSRAKAAPDALTTIAYLAAREQILARRLREIGEMVYGPAQDPERTENGDTSPQGEPDVDD